MKLKIASLTLLITIGLTACSSLLTNLPSNDELLKEHTKQDGRECIRESDIRGFGVLDSDVISVDTRARDEYILMTTLYRCNSLDITAQVGFVSKFAQFCGGGSDKIHTGEESCPVKSIFKFESREQAFDTFKLISEKRDQLRKQLKKEAKQKK